MILCAGEALVDMLPCKTAEGAPAFTPHPGGAVFNTAVALGRLGARAGLLAGLSTGMFGALQEQTLTGSGVDITLCPRSARPSTLAFVTLTDGQARYEFHDENTAGRMLTDTDLPMLPDAVEAVFCGGISLVTEPCGNAFEALFARAQEARVTMLDPNIRPGFIVDETRYRARIARMIAAADIVKMSDEDLHWLEGQGEAAELAQRLLARGPRLVLVTRGSAGASAFGKAAEAHIAAPQVELVDTVGAGDTFNAGILAALQEGGKLNKTAIPWLSATTLENALDLAARAAAATVTRAGANPPWAGELA
ncbi:fructokinase [Rhodovulum bhavnagarense]|uniref:Fructokinase n=1 Tax=Rhodovulum bhavnagarense TaxID=992286 RepID=A0A4R2RF05_9RHOB|nr:carbohydrate kinase [Rhodovulum bhavnagarense]TCP60859.1 fructokinase [Rhodovulum bhavnagarense]